MIKPKTATRDEKLGKNGELMSSFPLRGTRNDRALTAAERKSGETGRRGNWLHVALSEAFCQSAPTLEPMKFSFVRYTALPFSHLIIDK